MSTKMSTDLNITRPTSRVIHAPGGRSSNIFGDPTPAPAPKPAPVANSPVKVTPPPAPAAEPVAEAPASPIKKALATNAKVGIVVAGNVEVDFLVNTIAKALVVEGIKGSVLTKVNDVAALPFAAQNLARTTDVVIASTIVANDVNGTISQALTSTLLQIGVNGRAPVIPAIVAQDSLLEAKALLPTMAAGWAKSASTILDIEFGGSVEVVAAPEPVIPEKPVHTPTESNVETLLAVLRESLRERGARGMVGLQRKFRIADDDNSGQISLSEFTKVISEHALSWTAAQVKAVFDRFDSDKSGSISFDEFIITIRGELNDRRRQLVLLAFEILDADKSGVVELNDIQAKYNASKHPDVIAGKRTKDEVLREFLDTFDSNEKDGKVTPAEFCKYYENVSASIDEDDYFELMIRNAWHISGGEGWCANSSCRRVLATHEDGRQTVEEIKNDLGIKGDDLDAMIANLKAQGLNDIVTIELANGKKSGAAQAAAAAAAPAATPAKETPRPATAPAQNYSRRAPGGASSIVLG